jgi:mono/diheme cytochrome c family protein
MKIGILGLAAAVLTVCVTGCSTGKPGFRAETMRPDQNHNFVSLYRMNCSACHGDKGMNGAALPLDNPVYLAWAGHDRILNIVSYGVPHHLMPAFSQGGGGLLTNQQVQDIVHGMMTRWTNPSVLNGANIPGYSPTSRGNATIGNAAFQANCARCHGSDGRGIPSDVKTARSTPVHGSIVDPTYLALISDQGLRDIIVAGMPGEGMPDWRGDVQGKPLSDQDVTNIVAWLESRRVQFPGQSFPSSQPH